jgi:hypothetical protein
LFCLAFVVVWCGGAGEGGEVALGKNKMIWGPKLIWK